MQQAQATILQFPSRHGYPAGVYPPDKNVWNNIGLQNLKKETILFNNNALLIKCSPNRDGTRIELFRKNSDNPFANVNFNKRLMLSGYGGQGSNGQLDSEYVHLLLNAYEETNNPIIGELARILQAA